MRKISRFGLVGIATLFVGALALSAGVYTAKGGVVFSSEVQEPSYKGSISVGQAQESDLPGLAKLSFEEAMRAALARIPGNVLKAELEDENGYLVYGIEVVSGDRSMTEVKVDAGTGAILSLEKGEAGHHGNRKDEDKENES